MSTDCPSSTRFAVPYLKPIPNLKKVRVAVQPLLFPPDPGTPDLQAGAGSPWTALEWPQQRDFLVDYLAPVKINSASDFVQLKQQQFAAFALPKVPSAEVMYHLAKFGKPVVPFWDVTGHPSVGPELRAAAERHGVPGFCADGAEGVERVQRVLRAMTFLRNMRVLTVGPVWRRNTGPDECDSSGYSPTEYEDLQRVFGMQFLEEREMNEFFEAIEQVEEDEAEQVAQQWRQEAELAEENVRRNLTLYARVYLGLRNLLAAHGGNSLCEMCDEWPTGERHACMGIDCWAEPGPGRRCVNEFVPCWAYALLIDEGIPCYCKGDLKQLVAISLLMGLSGGAAVMGDAYRGMPPDEMRRLMEQNIWVQRHDLVPPSMVDNRKRVHLVDMHYREVGCANFGELEEGRVVTGLYMDVTKREWYSYTGEVLWTKRDREGRPEQYSSAVDNCSEGIAFQVKNAVRIHECLAAKADHQVLALGDWTKHLELLAPLYQAHVENLDEA